MIIQKIFAPTNVRRKILSSQILLSQRRPFIILNWNKAIIAHTMRVKARKRAKILNKHSDPIFIVAVAECRHLTCPNDFNTQDMLKQPNQFGSSEAISLEHGGMALRVWSDMPILMALDVFVQSKRPASNLQLLPPAAKSFPLYSLLRNSNHTITFGSNALNL